MAQHHRQIGHVGQGPGDALFVRVVERAEVAGHCHGVDLVPASQVADPGDDLGFFERGLFRALQVMPAAEVAIKRRAEASGQVVSLHQLGVVARQNERDTPAATLGYGVGGERGGDGNQLDARRIVNRKLLQHGGHALRQVVPGGQRLGTGKDGAPVVVQQHAVGVGAAGVDAHHQAVVFV